MVCDANNSYPPAKAALFMLAAGRTRLLCLYLLLGVPLFSGSQHPSLRYCAHPPSEVQLIPKHKELGVPLSLPSLLLQHHHALLHQRMSSLPAALPGRYPCLHQGNHHCNLAEGYSF